MVWIILTSISLLIWIYLILFRNNFWYCDQYLEEDLTLTNYPNITVIIPARNEADVLPISLKILKAKFTDDDLLVVKKGNRLSVMPVPEKTAIVILETLIYPK